MLPVMVSLKASSQWGLGLAAAAAAVVLVGCGTGQSAAQPGPAPAPADPPSAGAATSVIFPTGEGTLTLPDGAQAPAAVTYNPDLAPPGARVAVAVDTTAEATTVSLNVDGLLPNRAYAAHLHARPCGLTGADAGPHYQHVVDPAATPDKPSVDPQFANMKNEIWLDFATDSSGHDNVQTEVPFTFGQQHAGPMITGDRLPSSVVIHEGPRTSTEAGKAGIAGARIACMLIAMPPPS